MKLKLDVLCHLDQMYTILSQNKLKKVWKTGKNPEQKLPNSVAYTKFSYQIMFVCTAAENFLWHTE